MPPPMREKASPHSSRNARLDLPATSDCVERRCCAGQGTICCPPLGLDACGVVPHANLAPLIEEEGLERARAHEKPGALDRKARGCGRRGIVDLTGGDGTGRDTDRG